MSRHKDVIWPLPEKHLTYEAAALAVLMDTRDELKKLNRVFECSRFFKNARYLRENSCGNK